MREHLVSILTYKGQALPFFFQSIKEYFSSLDSAELLFRDDLFWTSLMEYFMRLTGDKRKGRCN